MIETSSTSRFAASNNRTSSESQCQKAGPDEQGSECRAIFWYLG